jgi:hypothetical protein
MNCSGRSTSGIAVLAVAGMLFGQASAAETDRVAQLERRLDADAKLIEQLTARVRELARVVIQLRHQRAPAGCSSQP